MEFVHCPNCYHKMSVDYKGDKYLNDGYHFNLQEWKNYTNKQLYGQCTNTKCSKILTSKTYGNFYSNNCKNAYNQYMYGICYRCGKILTSNSPQSDGLSFCNSQYVDNFKLVNYGACLHCGAPLNNSSSDKFCGDRCREKSYGNCPVCDTVAINNTSCNSCGKDFSSLQRCTKCRKIMVKARYTSWFTKLCDCCTCKKNRRYNNCHGKGLCYSEHSDYYHVYQDVSP